MDHHAWLLVTSSLSTTSLPYLLNIVIRNREQPIGYKLIHVQFDGNGSPTTPANSTTGATDIVSNPDLSACPDSCFRPVGLAWDGQGRLFMSSDSTGEIYVVTKESGSGIADVSEAANDGSTTSSTASGSAPQPSESSSLARRWNVGSGNYWVAGAGAGAALVGAMV
jgi:hypothetical protein